MRIVPLLSVACMLNVVPSAGQHAPVTIPVVFHVVWNTSSQNIPREAIEAELADLHDDFMKMNADTMNIHENFRTVVGNPNIKFVLADIVSPTGERGIIRVKTSRNRRNLQNRSAIIDSKQFLNVYIGNTRSDGFVWENPWLNERTDAIYLNYRWVGKDYRVLTHEAGHWLGLFHVFENGCGGTGDSIVDTPPQKAATDGACDHCPPLFPDQSCSGAPSNYNNFMDYSGCRKMFTKEQVKRIRHVLQTHRSSFIN